MAQFGSVFGNLNQAEKNAKKPSQIGSKKVDTCAKVSTVNSTLTFKCIFILNVVYTE